MLLLVFTKQLISRPSCCLPVVNGTALRTECNQGNDFGARICPYGIEDHGTSVKAHFCHVSLSDRNKHRDEGSWGNHGQIKKLGADISDAWAWACPGFRLKPARPKTSPRQAQAVAKCGNCEKEGRSLSRKDGKKRTVPDPRGKAPRLHLH